MYKCVDCGRLVEEYEIETIKDGHGFNDGLCEEWSVCPHCHGDLEEAVKCAECGEYFTEDEMFSGMCEDCLKASVTYENFLDYAVDCNEIKMFEEFVMNEFFSMELPSCITESFHEMLVEYYEDQVEAAEKWKEQDFIEDVKIHLFADYSRKVEFAEYIA